MDVSLWLIGIIEVTVNTVTGTRNGGPDTRALLFDTKTPSKAWKRLE